MADALTQRLDICEKNLKIACHEEFDLFVLEELHYSIKTLPLLESVHVPSILVPADELAWAMNNFYRQSSPHTVKSYTSLKVALPYTVKLHPSLKVSLPYTLKSYLSLKVSLPYTVKSYPSLKVSPLYSQIALFL